MLTNKEFLNQVIIPSSLPPIENNEFITLEKKYKKIQFISSSITYAFVLIVLIVASIIISEVSFVLWALPIPIITLIYALRLFFIQYGFPIKAYLLREKDISYKSGLLYFSLTSIPYNRIQHVEVSQGVIEKKFGLAKIEIFTAGGSGSDLLIPGLSTSSAHKIKSFVLSKVSEHE